MLTGRKINLRLVKDEAEAKALITAYNNIAEREPTDHMEIKHPREMVRRFKENGWWEKQNGRMVIATKDDRAVGVVSFVRLADFELEVGYRLYAKADRGQGYVSEALLLWCAYLFESFDITRLRIQTTTENRGSRRVAEKCGFSQEGILRRAYWARGLFWDVVVYGLLQEESPQLSDLCVS